MSSITDSINDEIRQKMEAVTNTPEFTQQIKEQEEARFKEMLLLEYSAIALQGLLASGAGCQYDTAHKAFDMAKMMIEVREQRMKEVR